MIFSKKHEPSALVAPFNNKEDLQKGQKSLVPLVAIALHTLLTWILTIAQRRAQNIDRGFEDFRSRKDGAVHNLSARNCGRLCALAVS